MGAAVIPLVIRPAEGGDVGLVLSSWLQSYYHSRAPAIWDIPRDLFFSEQGHQGIVKNLLKRCPVLVAHAPELPDEIYGWVCFDPAALHYVYIKELWRMKGVASALLDAAPGLVRCSHYTRAFIEGPGRKRVFFYDPYRVGGI
jgi:GNAT superfamily N-acetyltransferase